MRYGLALPNYTTLATPEAIDAAAAVAERLGWHSVWTTDHVLVDPSDDAAEYRVTYDALEVLAWVGARYPSVVLGTSVIVVPQRNAVVVAKQLASLDALSGGRVIAGIGGGWSRAEFVNLGMGERFAVRGAFVDETIRMWRHLWTGEGAPFHGRFHDVGVHVFGPIPVDGPNLPIWVGGRAEAALERAGRLADGYHSSSTSPEAYARRIPVIRAAAERARRPMPELSARITVEWGAPVRSAEPRSYALRGDGAEIRAEIAKWAEVGVDHVTLSFRAESSAALVEAIERFDAEVVSQ
jgi:probable F420-dependent oxidoreductase